MTGALLVLGLAACSSSGGSDAGPGSTAPGTSTTSAGATTTTEPDDSPVPVPSISGPVTGGKYGVPYNPLPPELAKKYAYDEAEYFVSGTATDYEPVGSPPADGRWKVEAKGTAPYETRIIVRRPHDPKRFSGVVLVEWLNVSAGRDSDPDFGFAHPEIMRRGDAYVGVSAQLTGVEGGAAPVPVPGVPAVGLAPLKKWDPQRYAPLHHPGEQYAFDIFSQATQVVRRPGPKNPLAGLDVEHLIAMGESQSAGRMVSYVDGIQPVSKLFDGFLIHSRGGGAAAFSTETAAVMPKVVAIRPDLGLPVVQFQTETDLIRLNFLPARQPDTEDLVTWEVAGTAHADQATLDYGVASGQVWGKGITFDANALCGQVNDGPQNLVVRAALTSLVANVVDGTPLVRAAPITVRDGAIARDEWGNALGGVRTPPVDAPTSALTGQGNPASIFCDLFGRAVRFTPAQLAQRYPSHDDYVREVKASAEAAVRSGHLLQPEAAELVAAAQKAAVPA